jgi:predicted transcriptional regulator
MKSRELTKAEEQLMQYLWESGKGFLKDIVERFPEPRPAYTTVSTVIGVLVRKGFIDYNACGKMREYYPTLTKQEYFGGRVRSIIDHFFNGSAPEFASFFTGEAVSLSELEEIRALIEEKIESLKSNG